MKKTIFTLLLGVFAFSISAQTDMMQLQNKITTLEASNAKFTSQIKANQKAINDLTLQLKAANENILQLQTTLTANQVKLEELSGNLDKRITQTEKTSTDQIKDLGKSLSMNTIYWIIAFLAVGFISYYLYRKLRGRLSSEKAAIYSEITTGNEQLKTDISNLISKNADDLKFMFSGELKDLDEKNKKSLVEVHNDYDIIKATVDKISSAIVKMEAEFSEIKADKLKASKSQQKAELS